MSIRPFCLLRLVKAVADFKETFQSYLYPDKKQICVVLNLLGMGNQHETPNYSIAQFD